MQSLLPRAPNSPKQALFLRPQSRYTNTPVAMGIGGSIDKPRRGMEQPDCKGEKELRTVTRSPRNDGFESCSVTPGQKDMYLLLGDIFLVPCGSQHQPFRQS